MIDIRNFRATIASIPAMTEDQKAMWKAEGALLAARCQMIGWPRGPRARMALRMLGLDLTPGNPVEPPEASRTESAGSRPCV